MTLAGIPDAHVTDTLILKQEEDDEEIAVRSSVRARSARISIIRISLTSSSNITKYLTRAQTQVR